MPTENRQRRVVGIRRVRLDDRHDAPRQDEVRQIVDVTVGVVAHDALSEPEDSSRAERLGQDRFESAARSILGTAEVAAGIGFTAHLHEADATGSGLSFGIVCRHPELG
jgi:hypothetical protein